MTDPKDQSPEDFSDENQKALVPSEHIEIQTEDGIKMIEVVPKGNNGKLGDSSGSGNGNTIKVTGITNSSRDEKTESSGTEEE